MVKHSKGLRKIETGQNSQRISLSHMANADGSHGKSHGACSGSICSMRCLASSLRLETMQVDTSKGPMPLLAKACAGTIETIGAQQFQKSPKHMLEEKPYCISLETCHIFVTEIQQAQSPICSYTLLQRCRCNSMWTCRDVLGAVCQNKVLGSHTRNCEPWPRGQRGNFATLILIEQQVFAYTCFTSNKTWQVSQGHRS